MLDQEVANALPIVSLERAILRLLVVHHVDQDLPLLQADVDHGSTLASSGSYFTHLRASYFQYVRS